MEMPLLLQFTFSHYNEKTRWALDFKRVLHVRRSLIPGPHRRVVRKLTGQNSVPVLLLDGRPIHDSTRIIEVLETKFPAPPLYPLDPAERSQALELEDFFDEELGPYDRRWFFHLAFPYPKLIVGAFISHASVRTRFMMRVAFPLLRLAMRRAMNVYPPQAEHARKKTLAAMDRLVNEIQPSSYLVGNRFSVADLTAAVVE